MTTAIAAGTSLPGVAREFADRFGRIPFVAFPSRPGTHIVVFSFAGGVFLRCTFVLGMLVAALVVLPPPQTIRRGSTRVATGFTPAVQVRAFFSTIVAVVGYTEDTTSWREDACWRVQYKTCT